MKSGLFNQQALSQTFFKEPDTFICPIIDNGGLFKGISFVSSWIQFCVKHRLFFKNEGCTYANQISLYLTL